MRYENRESERSRHRLPNLTRIPMAAPRRVVPTWVWVLIGLLGLAVVTLGGAWWRSLNTQPFVSVRSAPPPGIDIPLPRLEQTAPDRTAPVEEPEPDPARTSPEAASPDQVSAEATPQPVAPTPAPVAIPLSNIADLMAAGITVPSVVLELHVFDTDPSQRFVFINGSRYAEGQRTADGPRVAEIRREGVILSYEGMNFLVLPQQ